MEIFSSPKAAQTWTFKADDTFLTHLPLDKMAAISQTIFSDAFSWMKFLYFDYDFTEFCS